MSIGSWRALLKFSENPLVNSVYSLRIPHVQHVIPLSLAIAFFSFFVLAEPDHAQAKVFPKPDPAAGLVKCNTTMGRFDDFFDFEYAQKVWFEMGSLDALNTERAKYAAEFGPWFERFKVAKDWFAMYDELRAYEEPEKTAMRRGHDIEVAYNTWLCEHYDYWVRLYKIVDAGDQETFEEYVAGRSIPFRCENAKRLPTKYNSACGGPLPDWRSPEMKAADKAMMEAADKERCDGPCKKPKAN